MKKVLVSVAALMLALPVIAEECAYTPLQNLIRNIRSVDEIKSFIDAKYPLNEKTRCGGSLLQLAVLRGNPAVFDALLAQDPARANEMVDVGPYPIPGAPKTIPLILFASYYAPNEQMIWKLYERGADISKVDDRGRNLLWYMEQNPVLRSTQLYDEFNKALLSALVSTQANRQVIRQQPATGAIAGQQGVAVPKPSVVEAKEN